MRPLCLSVRLTAFANRPTAVKKPDTTFIHVYPPETGGRNATSSPSDTGADILA